MSREPIGFQFVQKAPTIHANSEFMREPWVKIGRGSFTMQVPASVKPAIWGAIGGAIAAMIIGFGWGGWVTGGTAGKMATTSAQDATVLALTPYAKVATAGDDYTVDHSGYIYLMDRAGQ